MKHIYSGSCHCQNIEFEFHSDLAPSKFPPRACDCDFCIKHGASYVSDPDGILRIKIADKNEVNQYQHGSKTAEFLVCRKCGVFVTVTYTEEKKVYAGINSNTIMGNSQFGKKEIVSPRKLNSENKVDRWKKIWFPDVRID
ncbi:MAG: aldehyde-activating protein [Proteobacteria bacterium]|nr:aldehyde-activating protein [Pseudomonadota bacterium]